jgi:DNA-binding XRE family transcriptional regulator
MNSVPFKDTQICGNSRMAANQKGGLEMKIKLKNTRSFNELLIKKGFSKNGLSKATKLGQPTIVQISNGKRNPSPFVAKKIVDVLEVNFDDIFRIDG